MGQLHPVLSNTHVIQNALQAWQHPNSDQAKYVEQRVIKQLLQALIFEDIIPVSYTHLRAHETGFKIWF
ncbi:hypothetical protein ACN6QQ_16010, partial [Acinetobacter baumannii]